MSNKTEVRLKRKMNNTVNKNPPTFIALYGLTSTQPQVFKEFFVSFTCYLPYNPYQPCDYLYLAAPTVCVEVIRISLMGGGHAYVIT